MRIGHYAPHLWEPGGISVYAQRLGAAQQASGHHVVYLSQRAAEEAADNRIVVDGDADLFARAKQLGLDVLHLHKPVSTLPDDRVPTVRTMHGNQGGCPSGSRFLARTGQPCHRTYGDAICTWGHLADNCGSRRPQNVWANLQNIRKEHQLANQIPTMTVSRFLKDRMVEAGCPAHNLRVIHSPAPEVDVDFTPPPQDSTPRFVYLGRLAEQKGVDWMLRSAARSTASFHIDIAGTGEAAVEKNLRALVRDLDLAGRVTFHGWLDESAVIGVVRAARAVVVPSVWHEPAGLVTLEAARFGRPVIASAVGGIPEYALPDFALHAAPRDVDTMAAHMTLLATRYETALHMGRQGYDLARERFSMHAFTNSVHRFYDSVLS